MQTQWYPVKDTPPASSFPYVDQHRQDFRIVFFIPFFLFGIKDVDSLTQTQRICRPLLRYRTQCAPVPLAYYCHCMYLFICQQSIKLSCPRLSHSVARCTEKSVLIRIFEMIRIFIRKSVNNTDILGYSKIIWILKKISGAGSASEERYFEKQK